VEVLYFGYGANSSEEMIEAIVGRKPNGAPAILEAHELCIQNLEEISEEVILAEFGPTFRTYCIRPGKGVVKGTLWILRNEEHDLIKNWEKHGLWYHPVEVEIKHRTNIVKAHTETINDPKLKKVDGYLYPPFLNDKEKMFEVARREREKYGKNKKS